jgi:hypothetical protein
VGYEEEKKHAPAEWSFWSAKELDEDDPGRRVEKAFLSFVPKSPTVGPVIIRRGLTFGALIVDGSLLTLWLYGPESLFLRVSPLFVLAAALLSQFRPLFS